MAKQTKFDGWRDKEESRFWANVPPGQITGIPPEFDFVEARMNSRRKHLIVKIRPKERRLYQCSRCDGELDKNGFTYPRYKSKPDGNLRVTFIVERQKYQCLQNKAHCPGEPIPGLDPNHLCFSSMTEFILSQPDRTNGAIARDTGYSDKTVAAFFAQHAAKIESRQFDAVFWGLTMDEKYLDDHLPHFVLGNALSGQSILLLEDNKAETIREALRKFKHLDKVKFVLMDTNIEYGPIAQEFCMNARIIRDYGHIYGLAYKCRNNVRKAVLQSATGEMKALLEKPGEFWRAIDGKGDWGGVQDNLIGGNVPSLQRAHEIFKAFLAIYDVAENADEAVLLFEVWADGVKQDAQMLEYYGPLIKTVGDKGREAFGYVNGGLTNNPGEAINRQVEFERYKGRNSSWQGIAARMACKAEVARRQAGEYLAKIEEEAALAAQDPEQTGALSSTAGKKKQRSNRMLAGQPKAPEEDPVAAGRSIEASLERSARMAERANRRQQKLKAVPAEVPPDQDDIRPATNLPATDSEPQTAGEDPALESDAKTPARRHCRLIVRHRRR